MKDLKTALNAKPVVYVTRDIERALGLSPNTRGYYIISNSSNFAKSVAKNKKNILLINETDVLSTRELLAHSACSEFLGGLVDPQILVFKNSRQIEKICKKNSWTLLNPKSKLSSFVEEKISQIKWLNELTLYLPPFEIKTTRDLEWRGEPFILQFNTAHTGQGTTLIESEIELKEIQKKFPRRPARASKHISGPIFTNNNIVAGKNVLVGNISYQITGLPPFTDNHYATIGNDWRLPTKILNSEQVKLYRQIVTDIGDQLSKDGWKGLFGVDVVLEEATGRLYLIEVNARQPASTTFESKLQNKSKQPKPRNTMTIFEAHLAALMDVDLETQNLVKIKTGAQIVQRITRYKRKIDKPEIDRIKKLGFDTIYSERNVKLESDLLRLQTMQSLIGEPGVLNKIGKKLL